MSYPLMHVSLCMSYFFSYVHNRLLSCFSGPLYMYQAFVFINEEICSPALAHDKEKKNPACEKIEQRQAISSTSRTQIFSKHKIYFCKLSTHFIADFNTYGSILIQLLHFSIEVSKTSNGKSQVTLSYHIRLLKIQFVDTPLFLFVLTSCNVSFAVLTSDFQKKFI